MVKKLIISSFLLAPCAQADMLCPCDCVPVAPTATATPTRTATPVVTIAPTVTPTRTPTPQASVRVINYTESMAIIGNPEIGFQTTRKTKAQVSNPRNIPLTMATFRTCAHQINTAPGVFNWSEFDNFLTAANAQGQTVQLGLIMYDPYDCGGWLKNNLPSVGVFCEGENDARTYYAPDWNNAQVQGAHRSLIQAFAAKYNNDSRVDSVDVRSIGDYGEWHHSCLKNRATGQPHPMPSEAARKAIIKDYHDYFTNKPLIHIIDDDVSRREAVTRGAGWRADCWGGHHEDDLYPGWLASPVNMLRVWEKAAVDLEPCGGRDALQSTSYMSISRKVDEAIEKHASAINTRSPIDFPDSQWPEWQRLLRKLGYRFVLRKASIHTNAPINGVSSGETVLTIENVGIAPNYTPIDVRFGNETKQLIKVLPGAPVTLNFAATSGTVTASMTGRPVRFANVEWAANGIVVQ